MKLDLNHLFEMFQQIEESGVLNERPQGPASSLSTKRKGKVTKTPIERTIQLPRLQMSEDWGETESLDAQELKAILDAATDPGKDPVQKLKDIETFTNQMQTGALKKGEKTSKLISNLILLETFYRLYNSFDPRALGFINEAFVANLYGASAEETTQANKEGYIGDITLQDGTPVSIKTKADGKAEGSLDNLLQTLNAAGKVAFDIYFKTPSTEGVGGITFYRFYVTPENITRFVNPKDLKISQDENGNKKIDSKFGGDKFIVSKPKWEQLWKEQGSVGASLSFSRQKVQEAFNQIVALIDSNIQELYENLALFSKSINEYLSSAEAGRATGPGQTAVKTADVIPSKTKEIVSGQ